tara:strand:+ start:252 stop:797 length:546 start_codon:yes stop_codon:yes gene_type:complete
MRKTRLNLKNIYPMKYLPITLFLTVFFSSCSLTENPQIAPPFKIDLYETVDYKENTVFDLSSQSGKPTIINFWFPSCPPCVAEFPQIDQFYLKNRNSVKVIGIQLLNLDSPQDGQDFVKEKNIHFAVGADPTGKVSVDYQIKVYPTTVFVNSQGLITGHWQGEITMEELDQQLLLLQNKAN